MHANRCSSATNPLNLISLAVLLIFLKIKTISIKVKSYTPPRIKEVTLYMYSESKS